MIIVMIHFVIYIYITKGGGGGGGIIVFISISYHTQNASIETYFYYHITIHMSIPAVLYVSVLCQAMMYCSVVGDINISSVSWAFDKKSQMLEHMSLIEAILQHSDINDVIILKQIGNCSC